MTQHMLDKLLKKPAFWLETGDIVTMGSALVNSSRRVTREHVTDRWHEIPLK